MLGQRIIQLRKRRNWNQKELAERLGISARQLVRWERNQVEPRPKSIKLLAEVLEVTPEELAASPAENRLDDIEDEELKELLSYVPDLDAKRLEALKMMLRDFITCHQFNRFRNQAFSN